MLAQKLFSWPLAVAFAVLPSLGSAQPSRLPSPQVQQLESKIALEQRELYQLQTQIRLGSAPPVNLPGPPASSAQNRKRTASLKKQIRVAKANGNARAIRRLRTELARITAKDVDSMRAQRFRPPTPADRTQLYSRERILQADIRSDEQRLSQLRASGG